MTLRWIFLPVVFVFSLGRSARASDANDAAAEGLFHEGRRLIEAGQVSDACPKFLASYKLSPAVGTLLNLADCYERNGQTATAWVRFREAIALSQRAGRTDRERTAEGRASALAPRLTKLRISAKEEGVKVLRDGTELDGAEYNTAIPVDPGAHTIRVEGEGREPWILTLDVVGEGNVTNVEVPRLKRAPLPGQPRDNENPGSIQRTVGIVAMGAGVVGIGIGTYFGITTMNRWSDSEANCNAGVCNADGVSFAAEARNAGNLSTAFFLIGGAVGIGGAALYFTAPRGKTVSVVPHAGKQTAGVTLGGTF